MAVNRSFALEWYNKCPFRAIIDRLLWDNYVREKYYETNKTFKQLVEVFYSKPSRFHFNRHIGNHIASLAKASNLDENIIKTYLLFESKIIQIDAANYSMGSYYDNLPDYSAYSFDDLSILRQFKNLESLGLIGCNIVDFHALEDLRNIRDLKVEVYIENPKPIKDIERIKFLKDLESLNLHGNNVDNLALVANPKIKYLELCSTNLHGLTQINNMQDLKFLNVSDTKLEDLSGIESFTSLEMLVISGTKITDLTPLQNLPNLKYIGSEDISKNRQLADSFLKLKALRIALDIFDGGRYSIPNVFEPIWVGSKIPVIAHSIESAYRTNVKYLQKANIWKP